LPSLKASFGDEQKVTSEAEEVAQDEALVEEEFDLSEIMNEEVGYLAAIANLLNEAACVASVHRTLSFLSDLSTRVPLHCL